MISRKQINEMYEPLMRGSILGDNFTTSFTKAYVSNKNEAITIECKCPFAYKFAIRVLYWSHSGLKLPGSSCRPAPLGPLA